MNAVNYFGYLFFLIWIFVNGTKQFDGNDADFAPFTREPLLYFPQPRIVGGQDAKDDQFPHQISLRLNNSHICGGSVISEYYVVTAAHCVCTGSGNSVQKIPSSIITVHAGSTEVNSGGVVVGVSQVIVHPNYKYFNNDIAIMRLDKPLKFNETIQPIALATQSPQSGTKVATSGWGRLRTDGGIPQILQFNTLVSLSNAECTRRIGNVPTSTLCLSHTAGNGVCSGDSGGPAVYNNQLVGVTNFIVGECGSNSPDGYANVAFFAGWIKKVINFK